MKICSKYVENKKHLGESREISGKKNYLKNQTKNLKKIYLKIEPQRPIL